MTDQAAQPGAEGGFGSADEAGWPLLPVERTWGSWRLFAVGVVIVAATWSYIIGEYVGYYLGMRPGISAMVVGTMLGMLFVFLAVAPVSVRYGIDSIASAKPVFGNRGYLLTVILQFLWIGCWTNILIVYFAKAGYELLTVSGIVDTGGSHATVAVLVVVGCIVTGWTLLNGAQTIQKVSNVLFLFIVGVGAWLIIMLMTHHSEAIAAAQPAYASESPTWNYMVGVEILFVTYLGWWPFLGAIFRVVPDMKVATVPGMIGLSIAGPLLAIVGLAAILALGVSDPAKWMVELGGPIYGSIVLVFVICANLGTTMLSVYAMGLGLRQVPGLDRLSWRVILAVCLIPIAVLGVIDPELLFSSFFGAFLAFFGAVLGPVVAVTLVDYLILRRQVLNVRAIYDTSPDSPYAFFGGFNLVAIVSVVVGFFVYNYLLDPLTYVSNTPFEYVTASGPTIVITGVVYWILTKIINVPAKKGAYEQT